MECYCIKMVFERIMLAPGSPPDNAVSYCSSGVSCPGNVGRITGVSLGQRCQLCLGDTIA